MFRLKYLPQAQSDLIEIRRYIYRRSGLRKTSIQYTQKIREYCKYIASFDYPMGRERDELKEGLRSYPFENYVIFLNYTNVVLEIVRIIEGHRDIDAMFEKDT